MQALILVGGLGTRLKSLINDRPKPMVSINNKPFLEYLIINLKRNNIKDIILATGYMSDYIENYFKNWNKNCINILFSKETQRLGTGGAIKNAEHFIKDNDFFILNGDTLFNVNFSLMYNFHKKNNNYFTMALKKVSDTKRYGTVEYNKENIITSFIEKDESTSSNYINGGIYLVNKDIFNYIPNKNVSFEKEVIPNIMKKHNLNVFKSEDYFIDIGIPADYYKFNSDVEKGLIL